MPHRSVELRRSDWMITTRHTLAPLAGLVLAGLVSAASSRGLADDLSDLTPAMVADRMELAIQRYDSIEYTVDYTERRNLARFGQNVEPIWVEGEGKYLYRQAEDRWLLDEAGYSVNTGDPHLYPERRVSGFDGERHYHYTSGRNLLVRCEDDLGRERAHPRNVFWRGGTVVENLLAVLRKPEARIVKQGVVDGHPRLLVECDWTDPWDRSQTPRHLEATISPEQAWLPIDTLWQRKGELEARSELRGLKEVAPGVWYPLMVRTTRPEESFLSPLRVERITSFQVRPHRLDPDQDQEEFRFEPPLRCDVVDRRTGWAWHNDPWWSDLAPWINKQFDWPRATAGAVNELSSHCDPSVAGRPAPAIDAALWQNGDPGGWKRPGRSVSVLYFFGGRVIDPHPRWVQALRTWHARYKPEEVELIGIATSDSRAIVSQGLHELGIEFPVAVDTPSERSGSYGKTFDAFQMATYAGILVIDPAGKVHRVDPQMEEGEFSGKSLQLVVHRILMAAGFIPPEDDHPEPFNFTLPDEAVRAVFAEWKRRAAREVGESQVRGVITATMPINGTPAGRAGIVSIRATPQFYLLGSGTPGGYMVSDDPARAVEVSSDADGRYLLSVLSKGTYRLVFARPGLATAERTVAVGDNHADVDLDLEMTGDTIAGQVVDAEENPIPGATIRAVRRHLAPPRRHPSTTSNLPSDPVESDDRGRFLFTGLYEGGYTLEILAPGFELKSVEIVKSGTRDLQVQLNRGAK
ncbi:MAG: carboxypeptidase regulatory-like domain-containing protein [Planctomycetales bacterium]